MARIYIEVFPVVEWLPRYDYRFCQCMDTIFTNASAILSASSFELYLPNEILNVKEADTFWTIELMSRGRQEINFQSMNINWNVADSLDCICVE